MGETRVTVSHVTKIYKIYDTPKDRFKETMGIGKNKQYHKDFYALKDVSFSASEGEIVGIIGRNGSGKSTILKILAGVLHQTDGEIIVNGKVAALLELGAGFNPEYTGRKNIYLNASMMRISHEEIEKRVPDIISFADIGEFIDQPVKTYSSGMFVRLAFSVAIHVDPDILIVDEALAVGDTRFQMKCMDKFTDFVEAGKTILFVTHDVNAIKRFCNRAIWLNSGSLIMDGNTDYVTDKYSDYLKSDLSIEEFLKQDETEQPSRKIEYDLSKIDIVDIHELHVFDSSGREQKDIVHGDRINLKVSYIVGDDTIENPVLGVAIRRIDNEYVCGINTKLDGFSIPWELGYNEITLVYDSFDLVGGEYYFDVGIMDNTGMINLDYRTKIHSFFVKMDYIAEGIVVLKHSWG
jgi:ABC-type polysaccharide/polyol phosphate transport system ATPase subunit